jgi:nucleotide-binding universal stress UspA family protein
VAAGLTYSNTLKQLEHEGRIVMEVSRAEVDTTNPIFHTARAQRERIPEVLVKYAAEQQCDLIVMGTHGRTGLDHLLLGSVAEGVAHMAAVPLLLVRVGNEQRVEHDVSQQTTVSSRQPANTP